MAKFSKSTRDPVLKQTSKEEDLTLNSQQEKVGNLQSYLSTARLRKLTVVFEYYEAKETYSRI